MTWKLKPDSEDFWLALHPRKQRAQGGTIRLRSNKEDEEEEEERPPNEHRRWWSVGSEREPVPADAAHETQVFFFRETTFPESSKSGSTWHRNGGHLLLWEVAFLDAVVCSVLSRNSSPKAACDAYPVSRSFPPWINSPLLARAPEPLRSVSAGRSTSTSIGRSWSTVLRGFGYLSCFPRSWTRILRSFLNLYILPRSPGFWQQLVRCLPCLGFQDKLDFLRDDFSQCFPRATGIWQSLDQCLLSVCLARGTQENWNFLGDDSVFFSTAPGIWQSIVRCCSPGRSTGTRFIWEMTSRVVSILSFLGSTADTSSCQSTGHFRIHFGSSSPDCGR